MEAGWVHVEVDYKGAVHELPVGEPQSKLEKLAAGVTTATELVIGLFSSSSYIPSPEASVQNAQKRIANPGRQLGGSDVAFFIQNLTACTLFLEFFLKDGSSINAHSLSEIVTILDQAIIPSPLVIPINFTGESAWERNHLGVILINDNKVEYYDPKGIFSQCRLLIDGTLSDVLNYCRKRWTNQGEIVENPMRHQNDAHNCGVFVCRHIYRRLIEKIPIGEWEMQIPLSVIEAFRETVLQIAYPPQIISYSDTKIDPDIEKDLDDLLK